MLEIFSRFFGLLQRIGRAIMLPVALLPAAGILLGVGIALQEQAFLDLIPFFNTYWIEEIAVIMSSSGQIIFNNLPLLFAVGIAVGLSKGDGVAALAALIGYLIMNTTIGVILNIDLEMALDRNNPLYAVILGIPTIQTGVFGGIIVGVLAAYLYNRFYKIDLPVYLGFFSGKRFVPIVTAVASVFLGVIMSSIWPPFQNLLNLLSTNVIETNETLSAFFFGIFERSLVPLGLHHIFYSPFWYEFGSYMTSTGEIVRGDQRIFFAQLADNVQITAGTYMTGKFPFMMFGLPGAALAMYHESKPENKKYVSGIYLSAALTSFLTGITEPLEFIFLFVAPFLYVIHIFFAGLSFMVMQLLNVKIGMTFSGGLIDFLLFGVIQGKTDWWWVIIVGLILAVIYYFGFRFAIRRIDIPITGRESNRKKKNKGVDNTSYHSNAEQVIKALGGAQNIVHIDSCITRLRIELNDINAVQKERIKDLGASGLLVIGNNLQIVFGTKSDLIKTEICNVIGYTKEDLRSFIAPMSGTLIQIEHVPDKVFSQKLMGEGFAIIPNDGDVVSPINGKVESIFPTKHAIELVDEDQNEILIHIGIDTIHLKGEGFELFVEEGSTVKQGDLLVRLDLFRIRDKVPTLITPIIIESKDDTPINIEEGIVVTKGEKFYLKS